MDQDEVPVINHNDGIFEFRKRLEHGETSVTEFAWEVINAHRENERKRIGKIKRLKKMNLKPEVERSVLEQMKRTAGEISFAGDLYCFSSKEEHLHAKHLDSFYMHCEPDYDRRESGIRYHGKYCWKVALLNAYRILEMTKDESVKFPHEWVPIEVTPADSNFPGLLASAAYQMGLYYAKAQALVKTSAAIRGAPMLNARKGWDTPLGKIIYAALGQLEKEGGKVSKKGGPKMVMDFLAARGQASTKGALWVVFVEQEEVTMTPKKLGKFIDRHQKRAES